jgi:uncharacterized integral membrane protein
MKALRLILTMAVLLLVLLLGIYNHQLVQLTLFSHQSLPIPLFLLVILCFAGGFLVASLVDVSKISRLRRELRREQQRAVSVPPSAGRDVPGPDKGQGLPKDSEN